MLRIVHDLVQSNFFEHSHLDILKEVTGTKVVLVNG